MTVGRTTEAQPRCCASRGPGELAWREVEMEEPRAGGRWVQPGQDRRSQLCDDTLPSLILPFFLLTCHFLNPKHAYCIQLVTHPVYSASQRSLDSNPLFICSRTLYSTLYLSPGFL